MPFSTFGSAIYGQSGGGDSCNLNLNAPKKVFDLLLNWSTHEDKKSDDSLRKIFVRDVCGSQYMYLGENKYLTLYRGLGYVDLDSGAYGRIYDRWVDDDNFLKLKKINSNTFITVYDAIFSIGDVTAHNYFALVFNKRGEHRIFVQYANLLPDWILNGERSSASKCASSSDVKEMDDYIDVLTSPKLDINSKNQSASISFDEYKMDCKTGLSKNVPQIFTYLNGTLTDKRGRSVQMQRF